MKKIGSLFLIFGLLCLGSIQAYFVPAFAKEKLASKANEQILFVRRTCQNGAEIMIFDPDSTSSDYAPASQLIKEITPYHYQPKTPLVGPGNSSLNISLPNGEQVNNPWHTVSANSSFFPLAGADQDMLTRVQNEPWFFEGENELPYYHYELQAKLYFHTELNSGEWVYFRGSAGIVDQVEPCRIADHPSEGSTQIQSADIDYNQTFAMGDEFVYQVVESPDSGDLTIGEVVLNDGDTFTEEQLDAEGLSYTGTGGVQSAQLFVQATYRVSYDKFFDEIELNGRSWEPSISADGAGVAFTSEAINPYAVMTDTNGASDVFLHRASSLSPVSGVRDDDSNSFAYEMGDSGSSAPDISPDGQSVAFSSTADNLIQPTQCTSNQNVFLWHRGSSPSTQVNCSAADNWVEDGTITGASNPSIGEDEAIFYETDLPIPADLISLDENGAADIIGHDSFVHVASFFTQTMGAPPNLVTSEITGNDGSFNPELSADGEHIAFESIATNLVENDVNGQTDIFVRSKSGEENSVLHRMTLNSAGEGANGFSMAPALSRFGEHVTFASLATNLAPEITGTAFQVYVRDRNINRDETLDEVDDSCTVLVSKSANGKEGNDSSTESSISGNGRFIAFVSRADNLIDGDVPLGSGGFVDIFVHDRDADRDGSFYSSDPADDRCTPGPFRTIRVSIDSYGKPANGHSTGKPDISANGEFVAFASDATNLVTDDTNGVTDVFVRYLGVTIDLSFSEPAPEPTPEPSDTDQIYLPLITR
ncbi:MAG: hypothetical protein ACI9EW_003099 [Cellvibrionaceae bacterium]